MDKQKSFYEIKAEIEKSTKSIKDYINSFVDEMSFVEMDTFLYAQNNLIDTFNGEGVVTGYATINDFPVYIYAQNYSVLKGGLGKAQADKIVKCMKMAYKTNTPIISIIESAGARLGEGIDALEGYAEIISLATKYKGEIPQIAIVKGECFGSMSFLAAINDFVIMNKNARLSVAGPQVIAAKSSNALTANDIGTAKIHATKSGLASFVCKNDAEVKENLTKLVEILSGEEIYDCEDDLNRTSLQIKKGSNAYELINEIFDLNSFVEISKDFATNVVTGFAKLGGITVGIVANNGKKDEEFICSDCARKASKFINICDSFGIPFVSLVNCKGTVPCIEDESGTLTLEVARLMSAIANARVGKLSIITNKAIGVGYTAFASKNTGFDYVLSFENAIISPIETSAGALITYADEIAKAKDKDKARKDVEKRYSEIECSPIAPAQNGYIDNIIEPGTTRQYAISVMQMLLNKTEI